jgi:hypothetical protein
MHAARIFIGVVFGLLSAFIVGYTIVMHDDLSGDEMFGFAYLAAFAGFGAGLFLMI